MQVCEAGRRFVRSVVFGSVVLIGGAGVALAQQQPAPGDPQAPPATAPVENPVLAFFKRTELSGFVDTYYAYNFNTPAKPCNVFDTTKQFNCLRNFEVLHNSFSLSLAEIALEKKPTPDSRGGFRIDLDYGATADIVASADPGGTTTYENIQQAYVSYLAPVGTGLQFDIGKFVTPLGYEVIESKDNWNYGRSFLFALAIPYYHTGVRVSYSPNDKVTLGGLLVNGWNNTVDNNTGKTIEGSFTLKPTGSLTFVENYIAGPEENNDNKNWRQVSDTIVSYNPTKQLSLAANYDYGWEAVDTVCKVTVKTETSCVWQGIAGYLRYQANNWFAVSPRYEYYQDRNGFTTGTVQNLQEGTLTLEFRHKDGVLLRVEYRHDNSNTPFFFKTDEAGKTTLVKSQDTITAGIVYAFSSKTP
jgi:hypothetical protein